MNLPGRRLSLPELLLPALVALIGVSGGLVLAVMAPTGATRLAGLAWPGATAPWAAIDRSGLAVVQGLFGGALIVVNGTGAPEGLARLRTAALIFPDVQRLPG